LIHAAIVTGLAAIGTHPAIGTGQPLLFAPLIDPLARG
jgi:hypothetical protein